MFSCCLSFVVLIFFFKQKTAYEMRISDWSSDVCSSDLMAYIGTSFIVTRESMANDKYRDMLLDANADDIILTAEITGIPANMLRQSLESAGLKTGRSTRVASACYAKWKCLRPGATSGVPAMASVMCGPSNALATCYDGYRRITSDRESVG